MISKDMPIGEIIRLHPATLNVFRKYGLDCNECQLADFEALEHGVSVHKVDLGNLLEELNLVISVI